MFSSFWVGSIRSLRAFLLIGLLIGCSRNPYYGAPGYNSQAPWQNPGSQPQTLPPIPALPNSTTTPFPSIRRPDLAQPGTIEQQRQRAAVHDPYADNHAAPPIEGGRPREFATPRSEATRSSGGWPF